MSTNIVICECPLQATGNGEKRDGRSCGGTSPCSSVRRYVELLARCQATSAIREAASLVRWNCDYSMKRKAECNSSLECESTK